MRTALAGLGLVLACASAASAQEAAVGLKAGLNLATADFDLDGEDGDLDRRAGFVGGLFVVWPASATVALQVEALYSQKGATLDTRGLEATLKLDYLDFPVLVRAAVGRWSAGSAHVFGGPSIGLRVRAHGESSFDGENEDEDIGDDVERVDFGLTAGAGVEFGRMTVDGRYTWGVTDLNKVSSDAVSIRNRVFTVMAGVRF
jgi:opacity protein-like surface antigen